MGRLLGKKERALFDNVNVEVYDLAGAPDTFLWKWFPLLEPTSSVSGSIDLLYGEPVVGSRHYIPYKVVAFFERPTISSDTTAEGLQISKDSKVSISRKVCEREKIPLAFNGYHIQDGDIFEFYRNGKHFFLEVKNVEPDGWINDSDVYTQYLADVVNNSTFVPDRKLIGSRYGRF